MESNKPTSIILNSKKEGMEAKSARRSPLACMYCRARKVRCDVSQNGSPCTNCKLDDNACVVKRRASRKLSNFQHGLSPTWRADAAPHKASPKGLVELKEDELGLKIQNDENTESSVDKDKSPLPRIQSCGTSEQSDSSPQTRDSLDTTTTSSTLVDDIFSPFDHGSMHQGYSQQTGMAMYCTYSFLATNNMFYIQTQDVQFLESEGCLSLPVRPILDQFLQEYFLHVHPLLPVLNEGDFWETYHSPNPEESRKMTLFQMQAMLFASCNCVPLECIKMLGYPDIRTARASFYRKAKLLYNFDIEKSPVAIAQGALLLSFWTPPHNADSKPNTFWLMIAIENAKAAKADLCFGPKINADQSNLRRLWWCCIIRDRILPLGLRRSIQITPVHFDLKNNMEIGSKELQDEIQRSRVYDAETRDSLAMIVKHLVLLSVIIGDVLLALYPLRRGGENCSKQVVRSAFIRKLKQDLAHWYTHSPFHNYAVGKSMAQHESVALYSSLLCIYYHGAMILVRQHELKETQKLPESDAQSRACHIQFEIQNSIDSITEFLEKLHQLHLARWLPITIVAYTAFPLANSILHAMEVRSEKQPTLAKIRKAHLSTLVRVMKIFHEQYDGVEEVIKTIRCIIEHVQLHGKKFGNGTTKLGKGPSEYVDWDLLISFAVDWSLSSGKSAYAQGFDTELRKLFSSNTHSASAKNDSAFVKDSCHNLLESSPISQRMASHDGSLSTQSPACSLGGLDCVSGPEAEKTASEAPTSFLECSQIFASPSASLFTGEPRFEGDVTWHSGIAYNGIDMSHMGMSEAYDIMSGMDWDVVGNDDVESLI